MLKFKEIWARLSSGRYQPTPLRSLKSPLTFTGLPSFVLTISPSSKFGESGLGIRLLRPLSLNSKAISVAKRSSLVFKLILYAIRNPLTPITVAPDLIFSLVGPKSGFHFDSFIFFENPSYSPSLINDKSFLFGTWAESS